MRTVDGAWLDGSPMVRLIGELDMAAADGLIEALESRLSGAGAGRVVRLDLSGLEFVDCRGVAALLRLSGSLGCSALVLSQPRSSVRRVFELLHVEAFPRLVIEDEPGPEQRVEPPEPEGSSGSTS